MDHMTALRVFRSVVENGSFAEAARRMQLSPAAVSKNIAELETHLGVRLLNRTTRRMSMTEAGQRYFQQIAGILDQLASADQSLAALQQSPSGLLRVAAPMGFTLTRLSGAMAGFLQRYPDISLDLQLDDRRVDIVKEGFDLAIRGSDQLEDSSLIARRLMALHHVVCGAPDYFARRGTPRAPMDLRAHDCVQFTMSDHVAEWEFTRNDEKQRVPIDGRYKVNSSLAIRDALCAGFGVSLIPRQYVQGDLAAGRLVSVLDEWRPVRTAVHAIYPSRQYMLPKLRAFVEFLIEETRDEDRGPD